MGSGRIKFLDGLRGLAILSVVAWHAYGSTYAGFLPYGLAFDVVPFRFGWAGVHLFFLISGFVILMTLEQCCGFLQFMQRRWLRLFPAMLAASMLLLAYNHFVNVGPHSNKTAINLIPGLLFLSPSIIHTLTGTMIDSMDGTFWSIYVEVCFYITFGIAYFAIGARGSVGCVIGIYAATCVCRLFVDLGLANPLGVRVAAAMRWLGFIEFGWFSSGALFYLFYQSRDWRVYWLAIAVGVATAFTSRLDLAMDDRFALISALAAMAAAIASPVIQGLLSNSALLFAGFVSYPLYLVHDNMMLGGIYLSRNLPIPNAALPIIPLVPIILIAWLIARHFEPNFRKLAQIPFILAQNSSRKI